MSSPLPTRTRLADAAVRARAADSGAALIREEVLSILKARSGVSFEEYRPATINRRIANRIIASRAPDAAAYLEMLREREGESQALAANLTIKVSRFYRNRSVFDRLREEILPDLRVRFESAPLRVWSAGCATGEEAYTLATLLEPSDEPVRATDLDERALGAARLGHYPVHAFAEMPLPLRHAFFDAASPGMLAASPLLRERVDFARHDLSADLPLPDAPPFHLICCRNVLIYFSRPLQQRALRLLVASLAPGGVLLLGEAEWPRTETTFLVTLDPRSRLFRRVPLGDQS